VRPLVFQLLRELSHERFVSGVRLAEKFGVSRSVISTALHEAGEAGVEIFSLTRRGYRLAQPIELLDIDRLRLALGATSNRLDLDVIETIDSTNTEMMKRAIAGAPSGAALVVEIQTDGRGRRGRVWQSAFGASLTFSLLWRFQKGAAQLGGLSLVVGLAVLRALHRLGIGTDTVRLKWPNDIVANIAGARKLAGVLVESQGDMLGPTAVVIGIGINMDLPVQVIARIDQPVTDVQRLAGETVSRNQLLAEVLRELVALLDGFEKSGFAPFKDEWTRAHALHGQPVRVINGDGGSVDAVVRGVADDGSLIIHRDGRDQSLASGEVSLRMLRGAKHE
jgi:BirA family biotin operon repressor/biotin-[acetyl-CoA-carboxylase] ligase